MNPYAIAADHERACLRVELRAEREQARAEHEADERYQAAMQDAGLIDDAIGDVAFSMSRAELDRMALLLIEDPSEYGRQLRVSVLLQLREKTA